jgi:hypothetical protein
VPFVSELSARGIGTILTTMLEYLAGDSAFRSSVLTHESYDTRGHLEVQGDDLYYRFRRIPAALSDDSDYWPTERDRRLFPRGFPVAIREDPTYEYGHGIVLYTDGTQELWLPAYDRCEESEPWDQGSLSRNWWRCIVPNQS